MFFENGLKFPRFRSNLKTGTFATLSAYKTSSLEKKIKTGPKSSFFRYKTRLTDSSTFYLISALLERRVFINLEDTLQNHVCNVFMSGTGCKSMKMYTCTRNLFGFQNLRRN